MIEVLWECKHGSKVRQLCLTYYNPWTVALQAPLSMEFSRQEYWSELPFLSPGDLPNPGMEPGSPTLQADCLPSESRGKPLTGFIKMLYVLGVALENTSSVLEVQTSLHNSEG